MRGAPAAPTAGAGSGLRTLALQVQALYDLDPLGRIVGDHASAGGGRGPWLFHGRARCGCLWRLHADLPDALLRDLARLLAAEPAGGDLDAPPERLGAWRARLEAWRPAESVWQGPAFHFPEALPSPGPDTRLLGPSDGAAFEAFPWLAAELEACAPVLGVLHEGRVVSIAYAATGPGRAVEAGVQTLPGHRGRGFATRAVAAWAVRVRALGRMPLYSTSFDNAASLGVARRLGLIRYGTDLHIR